MRTKFSKPFVRIFVVSDNAYLFIGIQSLIEDITFFKNCICTVVQTGNLPYLVASSKSESYDIVISDNISHKYTITQKLMKNTLVLPSYYDLNTYIHCFNNMRDITEDYKDNSLKKLSVRETILYTLFAAGIDDDGISVILQISKKTISSHRANILGKLKLKNRNELYIHALSSNGVEA